eukprot:3239972-Pleurochrysis_carterae.AAC.1
MRMRIYESATSATKLRTGSCARKHRRASSISRLPASERQRWATTPEALKKGAVAAAAAGQSLATEQDTAPPRASISAPSELRFERGKRYVPHTEETLLRKIVPVG